MERQHGCLWRAPVQGFVRGLTQVAGLGAPGNHTRIAFSILNMLPGDSWSSHPDLEAACVLLTGHVLFKIAGQEVAAMRGSLFDEGPTVAHHAPGDSVEVAALGASELAICQVENEYYFEPRIFHPTTLLEVEDRDRGRWEDTAWRVVRTVFDLRNRPESGMVLGEVVNLPGRWSSYPPHHHPQPELYHYRFTHRQGYGHAELGEEVFRVMSGDTLQILDGDDHSQVAAPGYGMWYLWVIRHLPGNPYVRPEFTEAHRWLLEKGARTWTPHREAR